MSELRFDVETHSYFLGDERLPSVTQILKPLYDFSAVPPDVLRRAAEFGTALHKAIELYLLDELDEDALDPALVGPLTAFKVFLLDHPEFAEATPIIETPGYHPKLLYAGTPDLEYEWAVIDLKSRAFNPLTDPLQLAGYDNFKGGNRERYVLELKQDGTYVFTRVDRTVAARKESWSKFRFLLEYHNMGKEISKWK